jgi:predicted TIM-barrel fold metal-dependent hydrolase
MTPRALVTTDAHLSPPFSLVDELPAKYRDQFAHLERRDDGTYVVFPQRDALRMLKGGSARQVLVDSAETMARIAVSNVCAEARPSFTPEDLLAEMAIEGVQAAVLIGNPVSRTGAVTPEAEVAYCRVVNDWLADTFKDYVDCFAPGIHLPLQDIPAAVRELERASGLGLRPAVLPDAIWDRPYHGKEWEPLWEAGSSLGIPFALHIGGIRWRPPSTWAPPYPGQGEIEWAMSSAAMLETIGWFTYGGIFERHPRLTIVMTEGYAGWLAWAIQFFDHHWHTRSRDLDRPVDLKESPGDYIKRQAKVTFMWDPVAINNRYITGLDCLMWGNDYPHIEGSFPESQRWVDEQFAGVPEVEIDQMVRGNAVAAYGFKIPG